MYAIRLIKHKNDRPHGIVNKNDGIIISIFFHCIYNYYSLIKYCYNHSNICYIHLLVIKCSV